MKIGLWIYTKSILSKVLPKCLENDDTVGVGDKFLKYLPGD